MQGNGEKVIKEKTIFFTKTTHILRKNVKLRLIITFSVVITLIANIYGEIEMNTEIYLNLVGGGVAVEAGLLNLQWYNV